MARLHQQRWCVATALLVPWLSLASPSLVKVAGVSPSWAVLWLLPWALVDGPVSGALAGLGLALLLDGLHPGSLSQIPALVLLGWWWGRIGRRGRPIERSFNLGLLALLGSLALNGTLWLQLALLAWRGGRTSGLAGDSAPTQVAAGMEVGADLGVDPGLFATPGWHLSDLLAAGLHTLLAQTLITALLAPMLCSLLLLLWRQQSSTLRG
ncbi:rod shape-determining protein MreD [Synechococcus sp. CS-1328]|uniref:rod shape-determining protein MreD n=1 Tax=Synechococcus sp. CS-1328 TaxID=2847976 RepID=UPI0028803F33|nr:rod shape-determining protein MreD [Synechococcus sp. CS-1328]MCT0225014.1 rod shape-determining protein MreD [Synechococcus sp. CS-1328]